jgi:hypothetical protein
VDPECLERRLGARRQQRWTPRCPRIARAQRTVLACRRHRSRHKAPACRQRHHRGWLERPKRAVTEPSKL